MNLFNEQLEEAINDLLEVWGKYRSLEECNEDWKFLHYCTNFIYMHKSTEFLDDWIKVMALVLHMGHSQTTLYFGKTWVESITHPEKEIILSKINEKLLSYDKKFLKTKNARS